MVANSKYQVGFSFIGMPIRNSSDDYMIRGEIIAIVGSEYIVDWYSLSNNPPYYNEAGKWTTNDSGIDEYVIGYQIYNTPLWKALREND